VGQGDAALGHHGNQITGAEFKGQVPSDAQDNDFPVKVPAFKKFPLRDRFRHPGRYRRVPSFSSLIALKNR
jgi:hypothetical protein